MSGAPTPPPSKILFTSTPHPTLPVGPDPDKLRRATGRSGRALVRVVLRFLIQVAWAYSVRAISSGRVCRPERLQGEGVGPGEVLQIVEAARAAAVAALALHVEDYGVGVRLQMTELRDPFRRLPVRHARIVQALRNQHGGIDLRAHVVVG